MQFSTIFNIENTYQCPLIEFFGLDVLKSTEKQEAGHRNANDHYDKSLNINSLTTYKHSAVEETPTALADVGGIDDIGTVMAVSIHSSQPFEVVITDFKIAVILLHSEC